MDGSNAPQQEKHMVNAIRSHITSLTLWLIVTLAILIFVVLNPLFSRERKYEEGYS